jgi:hypothetical protein
MFVEGARDGRQPIRLGPHVVVGKCDQRRTCGSDTGVSAVGRPLHRFEHVAHALVDCGESLDDAPGIVRGIVVDHDQLEARRANVLLSQNAAHRIGKKIAAVVGAHDNGEPRVGYTGLHRLKIQQRSCQSRTGRIWRGYRI